MEWHLVPSVVGDAAWIAELRAVVMRPDLERLGRFDPQRVRDRFRAAFEPSWTSVIEVDGRAAGCIAVRPEPDARWIEHFYLDPALQGRGIGTQVLLHVLHRPDARAFRLNVLQHSPAQRLYERHGFTVETADEVDVFMVRDSSHIAD
jgi:ribosomal protein S18 acetylase RimI-like enzyme